MGKKQPDLDRITGHLQLLRLPKQHPYARQLGIQQGPPQTPCEYFCMKFPALADTYGPPVLEHVQITTELRSFTRAYALNEEFFSGVVGGDPALGHHVVFYVPEQQWYFFDCRLGYYVPTTEEKLLVVLSQHLIRCAEAMPGLDVDVGMIFLSLRDEENLRAIIRRARSVNAADRTFFDSCKRRCGERILDPSIEPAHLLFIREGLEFKPEQILTVNECYQAFASYCSSRRFIPVDRKQFTGLAIDGIRDRFGLGCWKGLIVDGRYCKGWKGISLRPPEASAVDVSRN